MSRWILLALAFTACRVKDLPDTAQPESTPSGVDSGGDSGDSADADGDGSPAGEDCDDADPTAYPGATEVCDGVDDDCDGSIDEDASDATAWTVDADADGYGAGEPILSCTQPEGTAAQDGDCDDSDPRFHPGAEELDCSDSNDYNCDGSVGYADGDGDGYAACEECDDSRADVSPGGTEVCDGADNNCDGQTDEGVTTTWWRDQDGDGYGDADYSVAACEQPSGYTADSTDCADTAPAIHPGATEICDSLDNDCDTLIDEPDAADAATWYTDADGDGYGDPATAQAACDSPSGTVADNTDCDDGTRGVNPGATELCDGVDNNCDGTTDGPDADDALTWYADADGDGFGDALSTTLACEQPSGAVADSTDCDDAEAAAFPGNTEVCDSVDNDCDGAADGVDAWWDTGWSYRLPVTIQASSFGTEGPPLWATVDFRAALDSLGVGAALDPNSVRVVVQDCTLGQPELPSQFEDGLAGLFAKQDHEDPAGDEHGDVYFVWDEDGDLTALEGLSAGDVVYAAIYFDTSGSAPGYSTTLSASSTGLSNSLSAATFSASDGGMLNTFTFGSSPSLMSQVDSCCGNGAYVASSWSYTPMYTTGTVSVQTSGPVLALLEATGTLSGLYTYTYWYWMIEGRPELWSKTTQTTVASTSFNHSSHWTDGVRPWESVQTNISGSGATFTANSSGTGYADVSGTSYGVSFGYHQPPTYETATVSNYNPYIITLGNDLSARSGSSSTTLAAGTTFLDSVVMVVLPHTGSFTSMQDDLFALMEGASVSTAAAEAW